MGARDCPRLMAAPNFKITYSLTSFIFSMLTSSMQHQGGIPTKRGRQTPQPTEPSPCAQTD